MARTRTIAQFGYRVFRILILFVRVLFKVVGVTPCAIRLVRAKRPSCVLGICGVAIQAFDTGAVVAGKIRARMAKADDRPAVG